MSSEQFFLLLPSGICIITSILLMKKGFSIMKYDSKTRSKGVIFIQAVITDWVHRFDNNKARYVPILTYEINGVKYINKRSCQVGYLESFVLSHPIGTNVIIIGRPSYFGLYGSEYGGYIFEIYDQEKLSSNKKGLSIICFIVSAFLLLAGISMLYDFIV